MKVGYPDTINSSAYKQVSPLKARYTSSGEGVGELKAVELEKGSLAKKENSSAKKQDPPIDYNNTPINMVTPVKARSRKSGDINYKKVDRLNKRVDRLDKRLKKDGVKKTEDGYTGDSRREIRLRKQERKAGAAAGYGNMDEAKSTAKLDKTLAKKGYKRTPINMVTPPKAKEMSAKRRARRGERVERIDAKANSIAEQAYLKGIADKDLPTTAKKKYDRLTKKADRISAKTKKNGKS